MYYDFYNVSRDIICLHNTSSDSLKMTITVDANWLLSRLDDPNVVVIDGRGLMPYRFGHIKNSTPLNVEQVVSIDGNGSNLVINSQTAEKVFSILVLMILGLCSLW